MCCNKVHDKSPKYKISNCCGVFGIVFELLLPLGLIFGLLGLAVNGVWTCQHFKEEKVSWLVGIIELYQGPAGCANSGPTCTGLVCYFNCGSSGSSSNSSRLLSDLPSNEGCSNTCSTSNDGVCDDGGPNYDWNICTLGTDCADCGTRSRRLLQNDDYMTYRYFNVSKSRSLKEKSGRRLILSSLYTLFTDAKEDYDKMKGFGEKACDAFPTVFLMFVLTLIFGFIQLIMSSINACNCCHSVCGGYRGHQICNGSWSIVSTIIAIVALIPISGFRNNIEGVGIIYDKWYVKLKDFLSLIFLKPTEYATSSNGMLKASVSALDISIIAMIVIIVFRLLQAVMSFVAGASKHVKNDIPDTKQVQVVQVVSTKYVAQQPQQQQ
jgi:hypothetical protein